MDKEFTSPNREEKNHLNNTQKDILSNQGMSLRDNNTDQLAKTLLLKSEVGISTSANRTYDNGLGQFLKSERFSLSNKKTLGNSFKIQNDSGFFDSQKQPNSSFLNSFISGGVEGEIKKNHIQLSNFEDPSKKKESNFYKKKETGEKGNDFVDFHHSPKEYKGESFRDNDEFGYGDSLKESQITADQKMGLPINESVSKLDKFKNRRKPGENKKNQNKRKQSTKKIDNAKNKKKSKTPSKNRRSNSFTDIKTPKKNKNKAGITRRNTVVSSRDNKPSKKGIRKSDTMNPKSERKVAKNKGRRDNKPPQKGKAPPRNKKRDQKNKGKDKTRDKNNQDKKRNNRTGKSTNRNKKSKRKKIEESEEESREGSSLSFHSELSDISIINKKYGDGNYIDDILRKCSLRYGKFRSYAKVPYGHKLLVKGLLIDILNNIIKTKLGNRRHQSFMVPKRKPVSDVKVLKKYFKGEINQPEISNFNRPRSGTSPVPGFRNPAQSVILPKGPNRSRQGFDLDRSLIKNFIFDQKDETLPTENILADLDKSINKTKERKRRELNKSINIINRKSRNLNKSINIISYKPKRNLNKSINIISYNPKNKNRRATQNFNLLDADSNIRKPVKKKERKMQNFTMLDRVRVKKNSDQIEEDKQVSYDSPQKETKPRNMRKSLSNKYHVVEMEEAKDYQSKTDSNNKQAAFNDNNFVPINAKQNFSKQNRETDFIENDRSHSEILKINNALSNKKEYQERKKHLISMFKKMIIFSSKIEELKESLFNNPKFNIINIFGLYDEENCGELNMEDFMDFTADIGFKTTGKRMERLLIYLKGSESQSGKKGLGLNEFLKLFFPFSMNSQSVHTLYKKRQQDRRELGNDFEEGKVIIKENELTAMRAILNLLVKKIEDISNITSNFSGVNLDELFYIITMGKKEEISWKVLDEFFEDNDLNFIEEDLVHVFRDFNCKNLTVISFSDFEGFFNYNRGI